MHRKLAFLSIAFLAAPWSHACAQSVVSIPPPVRIADSQPESVKVATVPDKATSTSELLRELVDNQPDSTELDTPWWQAKTSEPIDEHAKQIPTTVDDLIQLGLLYSARIKVAAFTPQIRASELSEENAAFDWSTFANSMWRDASDPVGNSLTVGGNGTRLRDHDMDLDLGLRRRTLRGGSLEMLSQFGFQESNSTFFIPNNQATSRMVLRFTQPVLRGRGEKYNSSLIVLASIDQSSAENAFMRDLQKQLYDITQAYWELYLERANLAQKLKLYVKTRDIAEQLTYRAQVDASQSLVIRAQAALEARKSELVRSRAEIKNSETKIRSLINAPELSGSPELTEIIPVDHPILLDDRPSLEDEFAIAVTNRAEVAEAINAIRAASVRLNMASHEILPVLNLVTEAYVSGLRGEANFGGAWVDQFSVGEPGYSVGLELEMPWGRRAARARLSKRRLEIRQIQEEYRSVLELIRAEVEVAVREVETSHRELLAKHKSLEAANVEAESIEYRWRNFSEQGTTGGLLLDSLLRAQERVNQAEFEFARAQLTYTLSLIGLRHANGTLVQHFKRNAAELEASTQIGNLGTVNNFDVRAAESTEPGSGTLEWTERESLALPAINVDAAPSFQPNSRQSSSPQPNSRQSRPNFVPAPLNVSPTRVSPLDGSSLDNPQNAGRPAGRNAQPSPWHLKEIRPPSVVESLPPPPGRN